MFTGYLTQGKILELYTELTRVGREIVFIQVPIHMGIRGKSATDSASKDLFLSGFLAMWALEFGRRFCC